MPDRDLVPRDCGRAPVNGIEMYYEVHGPASGVPLVLLHGGGSTIGVTFSKVLAILAERRPVVAIEEQGHGRTSDREGPVTFEGSADDVAALLRHLHVGEADLFGFSNGASVALQVAIRHPDLVRKLVFASAMTRRHGARPELWDFMRQADFSNMPEPLKKAFLAVNPDAAKLRTMHDKDAARMRQFTDVPDTLVRSVRASTLVVFGGSRHRHTGTRPRRQPADSRCAAADCAGWTRRLSRRAGRVARAHALSGAHGTMDCGVPRHAVRSESGVRHGEDGAANRA
jgi:pimeloyl-ACP methyl ester carboxylesterase